MTDDKVLPKVIDYWDGLRGGRVAPRRSEINPRQLEYALENLFILEHLADTDIRIRFGGRQVNQALGRESRGLAADALVSPSSRAVFAGILQRVFADPSWAEVQLVAGDGATTGLSVQLILLPLMAEDDTMTRLLGCFGPELLALGGPVAFVVGNHIHNILREARSEIALSAMPGFQEDFARFAGLAKPALVADRSNALPFKPFVLPGARPQLKLVKPADQADH